MACPTVPSPQLLLCLRYMDITDNQETGRPPLVPSDKAHGRQAQQKKRNNWLMEMQLRSRSTSTLPASEIQQELTDAHTQPVNPKALVPSKHLLHQRQKRTLADDHPKKTDIIALDSDSISELSDQDPIVYDEARLKKLRPADSDEPDERTSFNQDRTSNDIIVIIESDPIEECEVNEEECEQPTPVISSEPVRPRRSANQTSNYYPEFHPELADLPSNGGRIRSVI